MESGITIEEIMGVYNGIEHVNKDDPLTLIIREYFENKSMRSRFLWEFLDHIFTTLDKNVESHLIKLKKTSKPGNNM